MLSPGISEAAAHEQVKELTCKFGLCSNELIGPSSSDLILADLL